MDCMDGANILFGLKEAGDGFYLPLQLRDGFRLKPDELHVLGRQRVGVVVPPGALVRLFCKGEQLRGGVL